MDTTYLPGTKKTDLGPFTKTPVEQVGGPTRLEVLLRQYTHRLCFHIRAVFSQDFKQLSAPTSQRFFSDPFVSQQHNIVYEEDREHHNYLRSLIGRRMYPEACQAYRPELQNKMNEQIDKALQPTHDCAGTTTVVTDVAYELLAHPTQNSVLGLKLQGEKQEKLALHLRWWTESTQALNLFHGCPISSMKKSVSSIRGITFVRSCIQERICDLKANGPDESLMSDLLFSPRRKRRDDDDEVIPNAMVVSFAGYDTTRCAITFAIFLLRSHPESWKRVVQEQRMHLHSTETDSLTHEILCTEFPYLDDVVKETLRLGSTSILPPRRVLETMVVEGVQIPKGWDVVGGIRTTCEMDSVSCLRNHSTQRIYSVWIWKTSLLGFSPCADRNMSFHCNDGTTRRFSIDGKAGRDGVGANNGDENASRWQRWLQGLFAWAS